jgi:hypothetical protein
MRTVQCLIGENGHVAGKIENPVKAERPRARRYPFVASIEMVDLQSEMRVQARVTDLSVYGCGVNASKSVPVGTHLRIRISTKGSAFSGFGKVIYATSGSDMGIVFTQVEPNDQMIWEKWISELRDR